MRIMHTKIAGNNWNYIVFKIVITWSKELVLSYLFLSLSLSVFFATSVTSTV